MKLDRMSSSTFLKLVVTWVPALAWWSSRWLFTMSSMPHRTEFCGMLGIRCRSSCIFSSYVGKCLCLTWWDERCRLAFYFDTFWIVWWLQSYPHKILTGRRDKMSTIRQTNGLSGFTKRSESEFDSFGAGHSSTTISAGLGNWLFNSN